MVPDLPRRAHHRGDAPLQARAAALLLQQGGARQSGDAEALLHRPVLRECRPGCIETILDSHTCGTELKYVLVTGGNWLGPIKKFNLTVEKPSEKALVSLCADGIKRASPTTFTMSADNYAP